MRASALASVTLDCLITCEAVASTTETLRRPARMRETTYPGRWFLSPLVIPVAIALAGLFWLGTVKLEMSVTLCLLLMVQLILFLLAFRRPVWAVAALLVGQVTASGYILYPTAGLGISVALIWTLATILLLIPILAQKGVKVGSKAARVIIPAIIFFGLATIANYLNTDIADTFKYSRWTVTCIVILCLLPTMVQKERDLKLIGVVTLTICTMSAIAAVLQHYYNVGGLAGDRSSGLSGSPILLGLELPLVLMAMLGVLLIGGLSSRLRIFLTIVGIVVGLGLIYTFTRSGVYSLAAGTLAMAMLLKGRIRYLLVLAVLIVGVAFLSYACINNSRLTQLNEGSSAARLVLWDAGVKIALDHPLFGIGQYRFEQVSAGYASKVDPRILDYLGAGANLGVKAVHNDFLRVWVCFGTPALLIFLWLIINIFRNFLYSYWHIKGRFLKGFVLGCTAGVIVYVINAAVHNIMDSVFFLWILGGLSIVCSKLAMSESAEEKE